MLHHEILENGLEIVAKENHFAKLSALQCWVKAGSIFERPNQRGIAHLIEHMLFKGTKNRKVGEIASTVEACGGEINAYTTFDRTVYYLTLSSEFTETGIELLADAIHQSSFDRGELTREKEVVVEEIRRGEDNPGSMVGRRVFSLAYPSTEIGRPIIGSEELVCGFSRDDLLSFYNAWYQPNNMILVAVGDFDSAQLMAWVKKYFGIYPAGEVARFQYPLIRPPKLVQSDLIKGDFQQPRLEIAFPAPDLLHFDTPALDIAAFALGNGDACRLNQKLREGEGLVTAASASLFSPQFPGIFEVSAFPILEHYLESVERLAEEIMDLKHAHPITLEELSRGQSNLRSDRVY